MRLRPAAAGACRQCAAGAAACGSGSAQRAQARRFHGSAATQARAQVEAVGAGLAADQAAQGEQPAAGPAGRRQPSTLQRGRSVDSAGHAFQTAGLSQPRPSGNPHACRQSAAPVRIRSRSATTGRAPRSLALFDLPFTELLHRAGSVHRAAFRSGRGAGLARCCRSRPAAARRTAATARRPRATTPAWRRTKLMSTEAVVEKARQAKAAGASRFCMGAAWRSPKDRDIPKVAAMIREVKALGLETCATLGMLSGDAGAGAEGRRPRLLQPQPRHRAGVLRRDHPHPRVPGPPRHAGARARRRHEDLLRRHRRHGRVARPARRPAADAGQPARASGLGADQPAGAGRRHAAARHRASWIRSSSCAPSRSRAS